MERRTSTTSMNNSNQKSFSSLSIARKRSHGKRALLTMRSCRRRAPRSAVSFINRSLLMKMIAMKMTYPITLINMPMISVIVGFVVRIMMKLAQAVRALIDQRGD